MFDVLVDAAMEKLICPPAATVGSPTHLVGKWRKITAIQIWQSGFCPPGAAKSAETVVLSSSTAFLWITLVRSSRKLSAAVR